MANTSVVQGTMTLTTGTVRAIGTMATTISLTGNNYVAENKDIGTGSYVALSTSSLTDTRVGYFANNDDSGSIIISADDAGATPRFILYPSDNVYWTWSGSNAPLFAISVNPADGVSCVLEYILSES